MPNHNSCNNCKSSDGVYLYSDGSYCFVCKQKQFTKNNKRDLEYSEEAPTFPTNLTNVFPPEELLWFSKYKITSQLRNKYNIKFDRDSKRIFLPVYSGDAIVYYQMRSLYNKTVKYKNPRFLSKHVFYCGKESTVLVIVEDIISAIRVGQQFETVALLGTSWHPSAYKYLLGKTKCYIWLDKDAEHKSLVLSRELNKINLCTVNSIVSEKDPKCYTDEEIRRAIND